MIQAIIFSADRPAQLDLLLRSIEQNAPGVFDVTVTYNYSYPDYLRGYQQLGYGVERWMYHGLKWKRPEFKNLVLDLIDPDIEFTCFFCDDDVIYRPMTPDPWFASDVACFSPRLGLNVTWDYQQQRKFNYGDYQTVAGFIYWDWRKASDEAAYPLATNGHIFRTGVIRPLLEGIEFQTFNQMEARLQRSRHSLPPMMFAYEHSCLVNVPANLVQSDYPDNRYGQEFPMPTRELNDAFLAGKRIQLDEMDFSQVCACRQEMELPMG